MIIFEAIIGGFVFCLIPIFFYMIAVAFSRRAYIKEQKILIKTLFDLTSEGKIIWKTNKWGDFICTHNEKEIELVRSMGYRLEVDNVIIVEVFGYIFFKDLNKLYKLIVQKFIKEIVG